MATPDGKSKRRKKKRESNNKYIVKKNVMKGIARRRQKLVKLLHVL